MNWPRLRFAFDRDGPRTARLSLYPGDQTAGSRITNRRKEERATPTIKMPTMRPRTTTLRGI